MMKTSPSNDGTTEKELDKAILDYEHQRILVTQLRKEQHVRLTNALERQELLRVARIEAINLWCGN